ncbi:hypothetical protein E3E36_07760 [Thermococcus sp. M36]|uniref:hypothetical protein n=1 Tax=Thermococcus sp. M36 TaxID=1638261 RepID=UPI00143AB912|nr:hypothetical protein [Thermococcus sp. M36]NJE06034.1 hypothetical protein [Thermococcus sp. M36]
MNRVRCLLLVMMITLLVSQLIPPEAYDPAPIRSEEASYRVYMENHEWVASLTCQAYVREYYGHLINWTLGYPHDYLISHPGFTETVILVDDWKEFLAELPAHCYPNVRGRAEYSDTLYRAILMLENITNGTSDGEVIESMLRGASYFARPHTNKTLVHVTVLTTDIARENRRPFLIIWSSVVLLSLVGIYLSLKGNKFVLVGFVVLLLLGSVFAGIYIKGEGERREKSAAFRELLNIHGEGGSCGQVVAAVNVPLSKDDLSRMLSLVNETGSKVISVEWRDYVVLLSLGVNPTEYSRFVEEASKNGWDVSVMDGWSIEEFTRMREASVNWTEREISVLTRHLDELPEDKRTAVLEYVEELNRTLSWEKARLRTEGKCMGVNVVFPAPGTEDYDYASLSRLLSRIALLVISVLLFAGVGGLFYK